MYRRCVFKFDFNKDGCIKKDKRGLFDIYLMIPDQLKKNYDDPPCFVPIFAQFATNFQYKGEPLIVYMAVDKEGLLPEDMCTPMQATQKKTLNGNKELLTKIADHAKNKNKNKNKNKSCQNITHHEPRLIAQDQSKNDQEAMHKLQKTRTQLDPPSVTSPHQTT